MATAAAPVNDLLVTVKAREVQRGMLAEMRREPDAATRHFLAAAHLELVLAEDYSGMGDVELAVRSWLSAASCFWRAGQVDEARRLLKDLARNYPAQAQAIQEVAADLTNSPSLAS